MTLRSTVITGTVLLLSLYGCAGRRPGTHSPEPRPLGKEHSAFRAPPTVAGAGTRAPGIAGAKTQALASDARTDTLTLRDALALALMRNPELASSSWERRAREARALQERLFPNPELDVEVENVGGTASGSAFDLAETTLLLSQQIETAGKRSKRSRSADLETDLAGWDYEARRLDAITETTVAFIDALASQKRATLSEETFRLADQVHRVVSARVEAGKVSPLEKSKASVSRSLGRIQMENEKRALEASMKRLASCWGSTSPHFTAVAGDLGIPGSLCAAGFADSLADLNPGIARWKAEIERHRAALSLEKARRFPDLTISGGLRWFEETGDRTYLFGLSVPIPFFDRNQGNVREAEYRLAQAGEMQQAAGTRIRTELSDAAAALSATHSEALTLETVVVPAAEEAFTAASEGYRQGKFEFLEVLDAQKTYAEVRFQYIAALAAYHRAAAEVERLIGRKLCTGAGTHTHDEGALR